MNKKINTFTNGIFWTAVIYISGTVSPLLLFALVIFTVCFNEDKRTRKTAITAVEIWLIFAVIRGIWSIIENMALIVANNMIAFNSINNRISAIITMAETISFIIMAVKAVLTKGVSWENMKEKIIISKYEDKQSTENKKQQEDVTLERENNAEKNILLSDAEIMYCKNCGNKLNPEDVFCMNCGTKK